MPPVELYSSLYCSTSSFIDSFVELMASICFFDCAMPSAICCWRLASIALAMAITAVSAVNAMPIPPTAVAKPLAAAFPPTNVAFIAAVTLFDSFANCINALMSPASFLMAMAFSAIDAPIFCALIISNNPIVALSRVFMPPMFCVTFVNPVRMSVIPFTSSSVPA